MEAVNQARAVIPAMTPAAKQEMRINQYHYKLWRIKWRKTKNDGHERIH